ncbi:MAG: leucine-rich repeat protein [Bacteroidales bacterium]|nr:leucine-rich repeat protein [Bacteroidales bacterium]
MKSTKILCAAIIAAMALSCTREAEVSDAIGSGEEISITATLKGGSKTTVQDGGTEVYWEPADEIKLFLNGTGSRFISNNTELAGVAQFTGTLNAVIGFNEGFADDNPLWGLYPYRADATSDGASVTTTLPAEQVGRAGSFAKNTHITLGRSTSYSMGFYAVCGGLRFSLTQEGIKKVTFEGNNGETLAGTIKMAFVDGLPVIQELTEPQTKLTLTAPADGTFQTGVWYYIEAVPGTLSGGYKMTFYKESESAKFTSSSPVCFKRGVFGSLADADESLIFKPTGGGGDDPDPEDLISFADPIAKYACVDKFDTNGDGEVSYAEAASATTLSGLFTDWNTVTSFEEIKYFTGVTSTENVFTGLTQLDSITIPAQITTLGTFENCTALNKVVLPEERTTIPNNCFRNCSELKCIVLPSKITSIGNSAFSGCSNLQRVVLPDGVESLPSACFSGCRALTEVELPATLTTIPYRCFGDCSALTSLTIPGKVTSIGNNAFQGCSSLNGLLLPENIGSIGAYAFQNCTSLVTMALPAGITSLATGIFQGCTALTSISWPTNLQSIGDNAFNGCYFESNEHTLELPVSVTAIGANAFTGIFHLIIPSTSSVSISSNAFGNPAVCYTNLYVPASKVEMYKVRTNWSAYADRIHSIEEYPIGIDISVDLGLSVKWASINVGASYPWEYGDYFAWGEVEPKDDYSWSTYKWCMNGSSNQLTKYCNISSLGYNGFTDNKTVLDPEDDAAAVNWGGSWRMPTKAEQGELRNDCTWEWTSLNGVYGRKVTSKKSGYTDKWIFLPAAGYRDGTSLLDAGSYGCYWSSPLDTDNSYYAYRVSFRSDNVYWYYDYRFYGRSVRPVCDK